MTATSEMTTSCRVNAKPPCPYSAPITLPLGTVLFGPASGAAPFKTPEQSMLTQNGLVVDVVREG